jgi:flagellar P-ring protein precursor FlgI
MATKSLAQLYRRFANPINNLAALKDVKNVAIVQIEAVLPQDGAREGERIDVHISSIGAAKSLAGGRLLLTPLVSPHPDDPRILAMASGPVEIEDPSKPLVGRIAQGAVLEQDWVHTYVSYGHSLPEPIRGRSWVRQDQPYVTFVLDDPHSEWAMAYTIAQSINEESSIPEVATGNTNAQIAMAMDPRTVLVRIPETEQANLAPFLARLENLQLFMPFTEARVTIHRKSASVVITGDVEISPAVVTYKGLTITTTIPDVPPTPENPRVIEKDFVPVDPQHKGGAKLADLVDALNQLRVPAPDRITIIEQLYKTGKLHATVSVED